METTTTNMTLQRSGILALAHHWIRYQAWIKRTKLPKFFVSARQFYTGVLSNSDIASVEEELDRMQERQHLN